MFRFWGSDSRGGDTAVQVGQASFDLGRSPIQPFGSETTTVTSPPRPVKRRRPSNVAITSLNAALVSPALKRQKLEDGVASPKKEEIAPAEVEEEQVTQSPAPKMSSRLERAKEAIELQFSQEILLKHQEHRLINQELAKCQVALEQLRRCHLIPYPVNVPTPEQMLNVTNGQGPALQAKMGAQVPQWAPPFGVTDGPYARHLAKWLIPDPKFDGIPAPILVHPENVRARNSVDARPGRNSIGEVGAAQNKGRRSRESAGQKLQALPSGYTQPKGKAGPCILKRAADGKMVKLVCVTCHREDFSSTQGFINHCRIAHKKEYKSHEEAAVACGHPIEVDEAGGAVGVQPPVVHHTPTPTPTGPAHPFARGNAISYSDACFSVAKRIEDLMESIRNANPVNSTPLRHPHANFKSSSDAPSLSEMARKKGIDINMAELVHDARTKIDLDSLLDDEMDESEDDSTDVEVTSDDHTLALSGMRMPVRKPVSPVPPPVLPVGIRPTSSSGHMPYTATIATPTLHLSRQEADSPDEDEMGLDLSPITAVSNNAPSLVSDDDDYDDSVDGSCDESEVDDNLDNESMTDVAEIHFDDEGSSALRHRRGSASGGADPLQLRKQEEKHVTFMSPARESPAPTTPIHGGLKRKNRI
ncbi:hypothetical protein BKA67DRAFT_592938 [Truncatella angustata]|uniref:AHC1-like C2H2 zinc-finger domain-containing protein n=1 Tax=Truncatella angustata TaxID=152316 RepID=A0A9P8UIB6_9PEZI|nr:uncharacterized protein BKA67DRAFT_592938 [Truncatella angustata]KAH6652656.1 hypothetical protein BKA67DRAFT_592938 [Truncatella angustata]